MEATKRTRRGPLWVYVVIGALGFPFVAYFTLGALHITESAEQAHPVVLVIWGAAMGWLAWRLLSRIPPAPKPPPPDHTQK